MNRNCLLVFAGVGLLLAVNGCDGGTGTGGGGTGGSGGDTGGSGGSGTGAFNSSVDGSKQLKDLSTDEAKTLCEEVNAFAESEAGAAELHKYECIQAGVAAGAAAQTDPLADCQAAYDECMANPATPVNCDMAMVPPCTATVDDYEKCAVEVAEAGKVLNEAFSCEKVADFVDQAPGAACKKVIDSCP